MSTGIKAEFMNEIKRPQVLLILLFLTCIWTSPSIGASPTATSPDENMIRPGQIGDSGYVVPVPEINIKSIFGGKSPDKTPSKADEEKTTVGKASPTTEKPMDNKKTVEKKTGPRKQAAKHPFLSPPTAPNIESSSEVNVVRPPILKKAPVAVASGSPEVREIPQTAGKNIDREKIDALKEKAPGESVTAGSEDLRREPEKSQVADTQSGIAEIDKQTADHNENIVAPRVPLDAPTPTKEVVAKKAPKIPSVVEATQVKNQSKSESVVSQEIDDSGLQIKYGKIDSRTPSGSDEIGDDAARPEQSNIAGNTQSSPDRKSAGEDLGKDLLKTPTDMKTAAKPQSFMESITKPNEAGTAEETRSTKTDASGHSASDRQTTKLPHTPESMLSNIPLNVISPLASDSLTSREALDYLKEIAPLLEELAIIMAKAPSLTVVDYDPSDPNSTIFPKDILVRMDTLKRRLQILDAKIFSIIPPHRYAEFHNMIRDSINGSFKASDALIDYFHNQSEDNLKKVQENLLKARELMRMTRTAQG